MNQPTPSASFTLHNPVRQSYYYCFERLGQGAFGEVWGGVSDTGLAIAVKLWRPTSDPFRDFSRWLNEQELYLKCLSHPYIISTYDQFVSPEGFLTIVMERAQGSLESLVESHGVPDPRYVLSVGIQLCIALEHVHSLNVIHRDVTPRNVLWFPDGVVKLADFGISKELPEGDDFARTLIGLPGTIPPELLKAGRSTPQSDIYQVGLVLLHLLLGRPPIATTVPHANSIKQIVDGVPRKLAEEQIQNHGKTAEIIAKMLRRRTDWRYQTPAEVRAELQEQLNQLIAFDQFFSRLAPHSPPSTPPIYKRRKR